MGIINSLKELRCQIIAKSKGNITLGKKTTFGRGTVLWAPNRMTIGNNVYIGKYCTLQADIQMGNDIDIANSVGLIGKYDHDFSVIGVSIRKTPWIGHPEYNFKGKNKKIILEDDIWIGYGAIIFTGTTIHRGAIVAAGSVLTHDVPPYAIVAGNPAKIIGYRFNEEDILKHEKLLYNKEETNG